MQITYETGYAITKDVEVVINSANGLLFADSTGAGAIREVSEDLTKLERLEFDQLFNAAPVEIQEFFEQKRKKHGWQYKHENLSCLKLLAYNKYKSFNVGTAIFDPLWSEKFNKKVIHAITLTYNPKTGERLVGTPQQITKAIMEAIEVALDFNKKSISVPVPCARPEYGIGPAGSFNIITNALKKFTNEDLNVVLCFDNPQTEEFLNKTLRDASK